MQKVQADLQPGLGTSSIVGTLTLTKTGTTARTVTFPDAAITVARSDAAQTFTGDQTFGTVKATTFDTNVTAAGVTLAGTTLSADGTDADISITITPKGTGSVIQSKVDINGGAIDGTVIGASSAAAATVTSLTATGAGVFQDQITTEAIVRQVRSVTSAAGTTALDGTDHTVFITGTTTHTITLPACSTGRELNIKNLSTGNVTVNRAGSDTIDTATSVVLTSGDHLKIIGNGTVWGDFS